MRSEWQKVEARCRAPCLYFLLHLRELVGEQVSTYCSFLIPHSWSYGFTGGTLVLIEPSLRPLSIAASLSFMSCVTTDSRSWKGARPTSPTLLPPWNVPSLSAWINPATPGVSSFIALDSSALLA